MKVQVPGIGLFTYVENVKKIMSLFLTGMVLQSTILFKDDYFPGHYNTWHFIYHFFKQSFYNASMSICEVISFYGHLIDYSIN
jgi:hypothetical protein